MEIKISVKTPKGQALGLEKKFRPFIIGSKKKLVNTYVSPDEDEVIWDVEGTVREILKIQNNLARFDQFVRGAMDNKLMRKTMQKTLSKQDAKDLEEMIMNQTEVSTIKRATAEELVEANKTWWQRTKEKFRKVKDDE